MLLNPYWRSLKSSISQHTESKLKNNLGFQKHTGISRKKFTADYLTEKNKSGKKHEFIDLSKSNSFIQWNYSVLWL